MYQCNRNVRSICILFIIFMYYPATDAEVAKPVRIRKCCMSARSSCPTTFGSLLTQLCKKSVSLTTRNIYLLIQSSSLQFNPIRLLRIFHLNAHTPPWCIKNDTHQTARDNTSTRQGNKPTHVDPRNHTPVNSPPSTVTETDTDSSTRDALCC